MSEMVERVAAAMVFSTMQVGGDFCVVRRLAGELMVGAHDFEVVERCGSIPEMIAGYRKANARAAIAAMREPTEAMCNAGGQTEDGNAGYFIGEEQAAACFQAMLDEALR